MLCLILSAYPCSMYLYTRHPVVYYVYTRDPVVYYDNTILCILATLYVICRNFATYTLYCREARFLAEFINITLQGDENGFQVSKLFYIYRILAPRIMNNKMIKQGRPF